MNHEDLVAYESAREIREVYMRALLAGHRPPRDVLELTRKEMVRLEDALLAANPDEAQTA